MAYIYRAELYCDECGEAIRAQLTAAGQAGDEETYDSDDIPKETCVSAADSYALCAGGVECKNRVNLDDYAERPPIGPELRGAEETFVGVLVTDDLTSDGAESYQESLRKLVQGSPFERTLAAYLQSELGELEVTHPVLSVEVDGVGPSDGWYHEPGEELSARIVNPDAENGYNEANGPLSWMNSARVTADPDEDAVQFVLSIDDPRGGLCFTVRRSPDGRIFIHTPHPDGTLQHVDVAEDHPGTLVIVDKGGEPRRF